MEYRRIFLGRLLVTIPVLAYNYLIYSFLASKHMGILNFLKKKKKTESEKPKPEDKKK